MDLQKTLNTTKLPISFKSILHIPKVTNPSSTSVLAGCRVSGYTEGALNRLDAGAYPLMFEKWAHMLPAIVVLVALPVW
jgi:hypothetical protein